MDELVKFDIPQDKSVNIIKVIGVGGGGSNAVENMYKQGVCNVSFAVCNTDSQALARSVVPVRIQLGDTGLGVGGKVEKGKAEAEGSSEQIKQMLGKQTEMVFVTAGMGGGTGTGAAPFIANMAREQGLLTIGVVTIPFAFEGKVRIRKAMVGIEEMKKSVDSLIVINNQRLIELYSGEETTANVALSRADDILTVAVKSIAEIITVKGIINRDFCDVQTVTQNGGNAIMSIGRASGEHRIEKAIWNALNSPLMNDVRIEQAHRLLYVVYSGEKNPVKVSELSDMNNFMELLSNDIELLWGLYPDDTLEDEVKVTLIATGFDEVIPDTDADINDEKQKRLDELMQMYYGKKSSQNEVEKQVNEEDKEDDGKDRRNTFTGKTPNEIKDSTPINHSLLERLKNKVEKYFIDEVM